MPSGCWAFFPFGFVRGQVVSDDCDDSFFFIYFQRLHLYSILPYLIFDILLDMTRVTGPYVIIRFDHLISYLSIT